MAPVSGPALAEVEGLRWEFADDRTCRAGRGGYAPDPRHRRPAFRGTRLRGVRRLQWPGCAEDPGGPARDPGSVRGCAHARHERTRVGAGGTPPPAYLRIVLTSGYVSREDVPGDIPFVPKPWRTGDLVQVVRSASCGGRDGAGKAAPEARPAGVVRH